MAAPTYASDLTPFDLAEAVANWAESTNTTWNDGGGPIQDGDSYLQGTKCISAITSQLKTGYATLIANYGSGITVPTDGAVLVWQYYTAPNAIDTLANGGQMVVIGSGLGDFDYWKTGGNDYSPNPYSGWKNVAVDPTVSVDGTVGSPTSTLQYVGAAVKGLRSISKGNPFCVDAIRYGRCEARFTDGDLANGYCTFAGFAASNDATTARWGLIQAIAGGYLWKGLITIGYSTAADFRDSNFSVLIDDTKKVGANFSKIEIRQAGTRVDWITGKFEALGTVARGRFEMIDAADVNIESCQFVGMDTFIFLATGDALNSVFRGCNAITMSGAGKLNGSSILVPTVAADASPLVWNLATDPDGYLDDMTFSKGTNAHHAVELGTSSPLTMTFRGLITTGFNASNGQNDSTFHVKRTSGTVTINVIGGTGNFSYKSAGATVVVVVDPVTTQVTCLDSDTKTGIEGVAVTLLVAGAGPYPYNASVVSITRVGSVATVTTAAAHGLSTGNKVEIKGADQNEYNRIKTITVTGTTTFTYVVEGVPTTPATGTITVTAVLIDDVTPASGIVSDSRVFSSDQAVAGFAAKGTLSPLYKRAELTGTVDSVSGISLTSIMISDE